MTCIRLDPKNKTEISVVAQFCEVSIKQRKIKALLTCNCYQVINLVNQQHTDHCLTCPTNPFPAFHQSDFSTHSFHEADEPLSV